jgi:hypothetical protein
MKQLLKTLTITKSCILYSIRSLLRRFHSLSGHTYYVILDAFNSIAVLGGGTHEWLIWLANPLCFTAILCLIFDKKCHLLCVSFHNTFLLSSNTILVAESGTRGEILTIKFDYIWLSSFVILTIGIYFYFKIIKK